MKIFCDFDGTISVQDTTDFVLTQLALPQWKEIENRWLKGDIGSAECMQMQIALIQGHQTELDAVLNQVEIDSTFLEFFYFCEQAQIPLTIISDGVDYFIKKILIKHQVHSIPVVANHLRILNDGDETIYRLESPYQDKICSAAAGVCKCRVVKHAEPIIYVGDGRSDFCVSHQVDWVFAKNALADYCRLHNKSFTYYHRFSDIIAALKEKIAMAS